VLDNGRQIGRNPKESILNRDYSKRSDMIHLLELIKPISEKEGHRFWQNTLRKQKKIVESNRFLFLIKEMIAIWPSHKYEIVRNSNGQINGSVYESNGFTTASSNKYLVKRINYPLNKRKIKLFTHENIEQIKYMKVTGKSKFKLEKEDILANYVNKRHKFFKPKTKIGHKSNLFVASNTFSSYKEAEET